jgi:hypothetical protein
MARYQYRVVSDCSNTSFFGNAYFALINPSGSGRKLLLRSLEVDIQSSFSGAAQGAFSLIKAGSVLAGEDMSHACIRLDSSVALPTNFKVKRHSIVNSYTSTIKTCATSLGRRASGSQNMLLFGMHQTFGAGRQLGGSVYKNAWKSANVEPVYIGNNESVALYSRPLPLATAFPLKVSITVSVNNKTLVYEFSANSRPGECLFSIENTSAGNTVKLLNVSLMDIGTADTPTLKVVPVGQMFAENIIDAALQPSVSIFKMNSQNPDPPSGMKLYTDMAFIPQGVPAAMISDASAGGGPKFFNYLHSRDFNGPILRNMLVELCNQEGASGTPDDWLATSHKKRDLFFRRAGFVLNPGEGIAIVNSAETAVGGTTLTPGAGGWNQLSFAMQVDDEDLITPTITLAAQVSLVGAEIRIYDLDNNPAGSLGTELSGVESCPSTTYTYQGTYNNTIMVQIFLSGYCEFNQTLTLTADTSLTVSLTPDINA